MRINGFGSSQLLRWQGIYILWSDRFKCKGMQVLVKQGRFFKSTDIFANVSFLSANLIIIFSVSFGHLYVLSLHPF